MLQFHILITLTLRPFQHHRYTPIHYKRHFETFPAGENSMVFLKAPVPLGKPGLILSV